jgi:hypothetical protein
MTKSTRKDDRGVESAAVEAAGVPAPDAAVRFDREPAAPIDEAPTEDTPIDEAAADPRRGRDLAIATAATVVVVGGAAVALEAALIPGIVLGVAAALAPQFAPRVGAALNPLFRATVRGAYRVGRTSRQALAQAQERVREIVAEATAEVEAKPAPKAVVG